MFELEYLINNPECNKWPRDVSQETLHGTVAWRAGTL